MTKNKKHYIITAGSSYLDIDAYACCIAMSELLNLKGDDAIAFSNAPYNYSVCSSLIQKAKIKQSLPLEFQNDDSQYIIVDVSDPTFIGNIVPIEKIVELFDHHVGFEEYWRTRLGEKAHIEFIGAAATQIYYEWKKYNLENQISIETACLLVAAILDNTLNLTSLNTTQKDIQAFNELCQKANIDEQWCTSYFSEVQKNIENNLQEALLKDVKSMQNNNCLPSNFAQLCVWDVQSIINQLIDIRKWLDELYDDWLLNIIDIKHRCSFFVCDKNDYQKELEQIFDVKFEDGVAKSVVPYLRKEIIRKTKEHQFGA